MVIFPGTAFKQWCDIPSNASSVMRFASDMKSFRALSFESHPDFVNIEDGKITYLDVVHAFIDEVVLTDMHFVNLYEALQNESFSDKVAARMTVRAYYMLNDVRSGVFEILNMGGKLSQSDWFVDALLSSAWFDKDAWISSIDQRHRYRKATLLERRVIADALESVNSSDEPSRSLWFYESSMRRIGSYTEIVANSSKSDAFNLMKYSSLTYLPSIIDFCLSEDCSWDFSHEDMESIADFTCSTELTPNGKVVRYSLKLVILAHLITEGAVSLKYCSSLLQDHEQLLRNVEDYFMTNEQYDSFMQDLAEYKLGVSVEGIPASWVEKLVEVA